MKHHALGFLVGFSLVCGVSTSLAAVELVAVQFPERKDVELELARRPGAPAAEVEAKVEFREGQSSVRVSFEDLRPAVLYGGDVTCYVVWAVAADGRFDNLGELWVRRGKDEADYQTALKSFGLMVTAEAYPLVERPSAMVLFVSGVPKGRTLRSERFAFADLAPRPATAVERIDDIAWVGETPLDLLQAEKAVELAERLGAVEHAPDALRDAKVALGQARNFRKQEKQMLDYARRSIAKSSEALRRTEQTLEAARLAEEEARRQAELAALESDRARAEEARLAAEVERARAEAESARNATALIDLSQQLAELARDRQAMEAELATLSATRAQVSEELAGLAAERDALVAGLASAEEENTALAAARAELTAARDRLAAEKESLVAERDALTMAQAALQAERDTLAAEKAALEGDKATLLERTAALEASRQELLAGQEKLLADKAAVEARLEGALSSVAETRKSGRGYVVNLPDILFDFDKATLKPEAQLALARLSGILALMADLNLRVEGHTDSVGTKEYNQGLSERRGGAVTDFLAAQGVDEGRMTVAGYGMERPVADNATPEGRSKNRRVEIVIAEGEVAEEP